MDSLVQVMKKVRSVIGKNQNDHDIKQNAESEKFVLRINMSTRIQ